MAAAEIAGFVETERPRRREWKVRKVARLGRIGDVDHLNLRGHAIGSLTEANGKLQ